MELGLGADGFICNTELKVRSLEAHRLPEPGKNFDAFYLAAKDERSAQWLGARTEFRLLGDEADGKMCLSV